MNQDPLFELTKFDKLNILIEKSKLVYTNEITDSEFKVYVKAIDSLRREIRTILREQVKYIYLTPILKEQTDKIEIYLERIKKSLEEIYLYFKDHNKAHIEKGLILCRETFVKMGGALELIQKEEASQEQYSISPVHDEIMKIAVAYTKGGVAAEAFGKKLKDLISVTKKNFGMFDKTTPGSSESTYFYEHKDEIKLAMDNYVKKLNETQDCFLKKQMEQILPCLKEANISAEQLVRHSLQLTSMQPAISCTKCGKENALGNKKCSYCSAILPSMPTNIDIESDAPRKSHVSTEFTVEVENAVSAFQKGKLNKKQFIDFIDKNIQKTKQTQNKKDSFKKPTDIAYELEQANELMTEGLENAKQGLEKLKQYASSQDESELMFAMDDFYSGIDKISESVRMVQ